MSSRLTAASLRIAALAAISIGGVALAQNFDLSWYTIDGGGATFSTGGNFELGGTIGQPDAGPSTPMVGGSFELTGGFWPVAVERCALPGDLNLDGLRDGVDLQGFVNCILGVNGSNCSCADLDGNGTVDAADAAAMASLLLSL